MSKCERCGAEFQAYCAKCRAELQAVAIGSLPSDDVVVLLAYDKKRKVYRYGCSVTGCPCNTKAGWCSKASPFLDKRMLHEYDGDNAIKQWCG